MISTFSKTDEKWDENKSNTRESHPLKNSLSKNEKKSKIGRVISSSELQSNGGKDAKGRKRKVIMTKQVVQ